MSIFFEWFYWYHILLPIIFKAWLAKISFSRIRGEQLFCIAWLSCIGPSSWKMLSMLILVYWNSEFLL